MNFNASFKSIAQLVALVLYGLAWYVKKAFGWDVQPSVLVAVGGVLAAAIMHAPAIEGAAGKWVTKIMGVAFACVAVAFTVAPIETAGAMKLSKQIEATELSLVPTEAVTGAELVPVEPGATEIVEATMAPDVVPVAVIVPSTEVTEPETTLTTPATEPEPTENETTKTINEPLDAGNGPSAEE